MLRALARMEEEDLLEGADSPADDQATPPPLSVASDSGNDSLSSAMGSSPAATIHESDSRTGDTAKVPSELLNREAEEALGEGAREPDLTGRTSREASSQRSLVTALTFRPHHRPPTPVIKVFDDDQSGGEFIRLRSKSIKFGRFNGDLIFAHEKLMSRVHAEIRCEGEPGSYQWVLQDLGARNGSYLRRKEETLRDRMRFWIGKSLVKAGISKDSPNLTLNEIAQGEAESITLEPGNYRIGQDAQECIDFLRLSPFLDRCHISVECDAKGNWRIADLDSTNGLWVAIDDQPVQLIDGSAFQLGEQRFLFTIP